MWGTWLVLAAVCLTGTNVGVSGENAMGRLNWCNTLCMCLDQTQVEVQCFQRSDIYELLGFSRIQMIKLEKTNWKLENQVLWCNETCLCHQNVNSKVFKCVEEETLQNFISDRIGDMYFYENDESASEREEEEEDDLDMEHKKRSDERKKNRKNRKPRKRVKNRPELVAEVTITTTPIPEVTEVETTPQEEVVLPSTPDRFVLAPSSTPASEIRTSGFSEQMPTTSQTIETSPTTAATLYDPSYEHEEEEVDEEEAAEILPKQEAVAASPAVTAMQPPYRRQPFPPTASSQASSRDAETLAPKVSAVLEVPVQRKTVASEVSQDLDELGSAVMQIKSDVVLNQRILLVTVAIAGIAMLGVLVLAVHSCFVSKRQAASHSQDKRPKEPSPKDDNHVTKVNLEEAW